MTHSGRKVIAARASWAAIFVSICSAAIIGGVAYAWNANADFAVLQRDVRELKAANMQDKLATLEARTGRIEEQVKGLADAGIRQERIQQRMDDKLDRLLESSARPAR